MVAKSVPSIDSTVFLLSLMYDCNRGVYNLRDICSSKKKPIWFTRKSLYILDGHISQNRPGN